MLQDYFIVRCEHCGAKNRVPRSRTDEPATCGKCRTNLAHPIGFRDYPVDVSERTFHDEVLGFGGPVATLFWGRWCGHCSRFLPVYAELASEYAGLIKFTKVDVDNNPALGSRYEIMSLPTIVVFRNGRPADRLLGALPKHEVDNRLRLLVQ